MNIFEEWALLHMDICRINPKISVQQIWAFEPPSLSPPLDCKKVDMSMDSLPHT